MRAGTAKDALLKVRWKDGRPDWSDVTVVIRHNGAPGNQRFIAGSRITATGASFFEVDGETQVPYHRILQIERGADVLYARGISSVNKS